MGLYLLYQGLSPDSFYITIQAGWVTKSATVASRAQETHNEAAITAVASKVLALIYLKLVCAKITIF